MSEPSNATTNLLVINPNSSQSITAGLREVLEPPPGVALKFYTAPNTAPDSIMDITTGVQSAAACFEDMKSQNMLENYDGFLVCCCK
jgi:Asp/Glu/hydantoin racemase